MAVASNGIRDAFLTILTARRDSLHTPVNERLGDQRERLVKAVATMLDQRLCPHR